MRLANFRVKALLGFLFGLGLLGGFAVANTLTANQGQPGNQGAWPVRVVAGSGSTASVVATTPQTCTTSAHKTTTAGVAATSTPSSQLASRRYITICNSPQNSGTPLVKCRVDGTTPVMAVNNAGDVLGVGDCVTYAIGTSVVPSCIADTATTYVLTYECS